MQILVNVVLGIVLFYLGYLIGRWAEIKDTNHQLDERLRKR